MESLVGYTSDDDIPDRRCSMPIVGGSASSLQRERQDSRGRDRPEMDNYDNIQMDMSEDSNSSSTGSGGSWRGKQDAEAKHSEEIWPKRDEEKRSTQSTSIQHSGKFRAQDFEERTSNYRDSKQNSSSNYPEKPHEGNKVYSADQEDRKSSGEKRSENSYNYKRECNDGISRLGRDDDSNKICGEDRIHRRLEADDKTSDSRRFREDKKDDRYNPHSGDERSGFDKRASDNNSRHERLDKRDDNHRNFADRDSKRSGTEKRDSRNKPSANDRQGKRASVEKRNDNKYNPHSEDRDERKSGRSISREKTSESNRVSHDGDERKRERSRSREKASDGKRSSHDRDDKRRLQSKSHDRLSQSRRAPNEREEKKSRRSGSRDRASQSKSVFHDRDKSGRSKSREKADDRRSEQRRDGKLKRGSSWMDKRDEDRQTDRKRSKNRSRSRSRGKSRDSPANERRGSPPKRSKRSPDRRRHSRERNTGGGRGQYDKKPSKLSILERLGITLPTVTDLQGAVTPQQLVQRSMALQVQQVKSTTGIELPSYYNPAAMNPARYAEQIQKRRLLWGNKNESAAVKPAAAPVQAPPVAGANNWEGTTFKSDHDGMMTAKFKRLMGIKNQDSSAAEGSSGAARKPAEGNEIIKKQEEMFNSMEMQYEVARVATHTHRGLGLGFGTFQYPR